MVAVRVTRPQGGVGPREGLVRGLSHGPKNGTILTYWQEESLISIVKVKETLLIKDLKHTLNENISSENLYNNNNNIQYL